MAARQPGDKAKYRVLVGMNYPDPARRGEEKRAEPGDIIDDLPPKTDVRDLLERGMIQAADAPYPPPVVDVEEGVG